MLSFRRSSMAAVAAVITASLSGCGGDYPDSGRIDTKMLRSEAKIIEVEGNVYGVKPGGLDAYAIYEGDRRALNSAISKAWGAYNNGEEAPALSLRFTGSDLDLASLQSAIKEGVVNAESKGDAKIAEEIASAQANRDELVAKLDEVSQGGSKFESYVAKTKAEHAAAEKALSNAIDAYNAEIERPLTKINELAAANGLKKVASRQNPVRSYRTIDFKSGAMPSSCPKKRRYAAVDMRAEKKMCGYIHIPSGFDKFADEIVGVTKTAIVNITDMEARLGKKRSWGNKASGAYAVRDDAKKAYESRAAEARKKYGDNRRRERQQEYLANQIKQADSDLTRLQSDDYRKQVMGRTYASLPDAARDSVSQHVDAAYKNLVGHIVKGPLVTLGEKDAMFGDLEDGFEGAVVVADFIAERRNHRDNAVSVLFVDLTDEAVKTADEIVFELTKNSFRDGRGVDIGDPEEIEEAIIDLLDDIVDERARADKA